MMTAAFLLLLLLPCWWSCSVFFVHGFHPHQSSYSSTKMSSKSRQQRLQQKQQYLSSRLHLSSSPVQQPQSEKEDAAIQWDLFQKHHALGSWKGIWTTYDYIGDVQDETVASVNLNINEDAIDQIDHSHTIVVGAKRSDCATCFDSMELKTFPVATYTPATFVQKPQQQPQQRNTRLAGVAMVNGPSILKKSGAMATELILKHGDGRIRVTFHHAPVWEQGVEPGSCPPQGLKLFRTILSREALRETAPTAELEGSNNNNPPPTKGNPIFFRPVPPFNWHKKWSGTSWTWGPQTGNRGWAIDEVEETDAWHGITPVDCWNLRLGSIHMQAPKIVTPDSVGICRLAWLPDDETLLRVEAGVSALQPMVLDDDSMVGFEPPRLTSLRCDMLQKTGELDVTERPFRGTSSGQQEAVDHDMTKDVLNKRDSSPKGEENSAVTADNESPSQPPAPSTIKAATADKDPESLRDSLSL